ncbi:alpha-ketoglutarate permease [Salmonella enterica]|nr:alpha-ketoglutarate permease [Salmonella enterica]
MTLEGIMFEKLGLPKKLLWGYIGLTIFMIGDGVEQAWISIWLVEKVCLLPRHLI